MTLEGKTAVITGASAGIGASVARMLHERGVNVGLVSRRGDDLGLEGAMAAACDVRDAAAVEAMIEAIWAEGPLDVLMNNAAGNFLARTEELSLGAFQSVIGIVLLGTLHTTLSCGRRWLVAGHGGVVLESQGLQAQAERNHVLSEWAA